jgi:small subunit ribosomal protein S16
MAVHIRLRKIGKNPKKKPHFRVTISDERKGRDSRVIEEIGFYNPVDESVKIKKERLEYWLKNGAQLSDTLKSLVKKIDKEAKNAASANS